VLLVDAGAVVLLVADGRFQLDHADFPQFILSVGLALDVDDVVVLARRRGSGDVV